jgi:hypothetical protein
MLTFFSSMLCTSKIHPFSLHNYLGTSLTIGNLMRIRVTSVYLDEVALPVVQFSDAKHCASVLSTFLLENSLYFGVNEIISCQKQVGNFR